MKKNNHHLAALLAHCRAVTYAHRINADRHRRKRQEHSAKDRDNAAEKWQAWGDALAAIMEASDARAR